MISTADFVWYVSTAGYEWVHKPHPPLGGLADKVLAAIGGKHSENYVLEPAESSGANFAETLYCPGAVNPPVFRTFAATPPTQEGLKAFADRFGSLDKGNWSFDVLEEELALAHDLVALWDWCRTNNTRQLEDHIVWRQHTGQVWYYSRPDNRSKQVQNPMRLDRHELIAGPEDHPGPPGVFWHAVIPPGDILLPALAYLQRAVTERIGIQTRPCLAWDPLTGALRLTYRPQSLRALIWLQFAHEINEVFRYRPCLVCGQWIWLSPENARTNRKVCSISCRNRLFQGRKARAREMHKQGKSLTAISRELEADVATVRGWVRARAGHKK